MKITNMFAAVLFLLSPIDAGATELNAVVDQSHMEFVAHTSLFKVTGKLHDFDAQASFERDYTNGSVNLRIAMADLDTGISARDRHLRSEDFFWVEQYPYATFKSKRIIKQSAKDFIIVGDLKLRGVKKELQVPVTITKELRNRQIHHRVRGTITLKRQEFGIVYQASFPLPSIKDNVDVHFDILLAQ